MSTLATVFGYGLLSARAAASVAGRFYYATDTTLMYRDNGSTWDTLSVGTGSMATDTLWDASGDLAQGTGANTGAKLTLGTQGKVLKAGASSAGWTFGLYFSRRIIATNFANADSTFSVNSATYVAHGSSHFYHDWDAFPATHFKISGFGFANESGQTIKCQFAAAATPTTPYSAAGDDITFVFNSGASLLTDGGWVAMNSTPTGIIAVTVAYKGSNNTVDFTGRWLEIAMKIV